MRVLNVLVNNDITPIRYLSSVCPVFEDFAQLFISQRCLACIFHQLYWDGWSRILTIPCHAQLINLSYLPMHEHGNSMLLGQALSQFDILCHHFCSEIWIVGAIHHTCKLCLPAKRVPRWDSHSIEQPRWEMWAWTHLNQDTGWLKLYVYSILIGTPGNHTGVRCPEWFDMHWQDLLHIKNHRWLHHQSRAAVSNPLHFFLRSSSLRPWHNPAPRRACLSRSWPRSRARSRRSAQSVVQTKQSTVSPGRLKGIGRGNGCLQRSIHKGEKMMSTMTLPRVTRHTWWLSGCSFSTSCCWPVMNNDALSHTRHRRSLESVLISTNKRHHLSNFQDLHSPSQWSSHSLPGLMTNNIFPNIWATFAGHCIMGCRTCPSLWC